MSRNEWALHEADLKKTNAIRIWLFKDKICILWAFF